MTDEPTTDPSADRSRSKRRPTRTRPPRARSRPNYAARRMLVSSVAITIAVAALIVGWQVIRGSEDDLVTAGDWDAVALVDRTSGDVTYVDRDGEPGATVQGVGRVVRVEAAGDRLALIGVDQIALVGVDGDSEPIVVPIERNSVVVRLPVADTLALAIGRTTGGNVRIVDGSSGEVLDVGELAEQANPLMFVETVKAAPDGSAFAVADAANFQTIVVRPGEAEPTYYPDQPVALDSARVVTSQVVGRRATIELFDRDGESEGSVPTAIPIAGVLQDGRLVMVSTEGDVIRVGDTAERLGAVSVPAGAAIRWVRPTFDGERLVVFGDVFQAVIDLDGTTLFTTTFTDPVDATEPRPDWRCLPVGGTDDAHSLITLADGEQLASLRGLEVTAVSADGCTVLGVRAGVHEVIGADGSVNLGRPRSAELAPDGRTVLQQTTAGRTELVAIASDWTLDEAIEPDVDVPSSLAVAFVER